MCTAIPQAASRASCTAIPQAVSWASCTAVPQAASRASYTAALLLQPHQTSALLLQPHQTSASASKPGTPPCYSHHPTMAVTASLSSSPSATGGASFATAGRCSAAGGGPPAVRPHSADCVAAPPRPAELACGPPGVWVRVDCVAAARWRMSGALPLKSPKLAQLILEGQCGPVPTTFPTTAPATANQPANRCCQPTNRFPATAPATADQPLRLPPSGPVPTTWPLMPPKAARAAAAPAAAPAPSAPATPRTPPALDHGHPATATATATAPFRPGLDRGHPATATATATAPFRPGPCGSTQAQPGRSPAGGAASASGPLPPWPSAPVGVWVGGAEAGCPWGEARGSPAPPSRSKSRLSRWVGGGG